MCGQIGLRCFKSNNYMYIQTHVTKTCLYTFKYVKLYNTCSRECLYVCTLSSLIDELLYHAELKTCHIYIDMIYMSSHFTSL